MAIIHIGIRSCQIMTHRMIMLLIQSKIVFRAKSYVLSVLKEVFTTEEMNKPLHKRYLENKM